MRFFIIGGIPLSLVNFRGELIRLIASRGHEVVAMSGPDDGTIEAQLIERGATFKSFPLSRDGLNPKADLETARALRQIFDQEKPDTVLAYTIKPVIYGGLAARRHQNIRFFALITGLGTPFAPGGFKRKVVRTIASKLYRLALKRSAGVIFQNKDDMELLIGDGVVEREKCHIVHGSGVDMKAFPKTPLPDGPPVFVVVARLLIAKGIREFAAAAEIVKRQYPEAEFRMVGWKDETSVGVPSEEIDAWVASGTVQYDGPRSDILQVLKDCHVFTLPSFYGEGLPRTILEAMAVGRPILTTDNVGCREPVVVGENGFLVPVKDADALAERMIWFIENRDQWQTMADASRRLAEDRYDVRKVNQSLLEIMKID